MRFSPVSQGTPNAIAALARKFAQSIVQVTSSINNFFAEGLFVVQAEATPTGANSRISLSVKASATDTAPATASLYLDAMSDGTSRIVMAANQTTIQDSSGNVLATWGTDGSLTPARITAGTISSTNFYKYGDTGVSVDEENFSIPSTTTLFTAHAGKKCLLKINLGGFPVPVSQFVVASFTANYQPTTSSVYVCRAGLEGYVASTATWELIPGSLVAQTTQSLSAVQEISLVFPVSHTQYTYVRPFIAAGSDDVYVNSTSFELRTLYK